MRGRRTLGLADVLLDLARRLLPAERRNWASAMRAEADQVPQEERLRWATGCVWTAVKMRAYSMNTGSYRVSRGVMLVEAIGAFGPLTFAWYEVVSGLPGVARNSGHIQAMWMLSAVVDLLGPIGLFLGLRYVLAGKGIQQRTFGWTLAAVPVAANLVGAASGQ
ncbi:MAG TPA: hypothetical protein VMI92_11365, partial [Steroidobacteraceae bacterium]|nr:hypothetical protein [Steroidobacteraceae bacterium]